MAAEDAHSMSSTDAEKASHLPQQQVKDKPTADHLEHYTGNNRGGFSSELAAIQEAHGFKAEAGRLVVDPEEARIEYGEEVASRLKRNRRGDKILWPQPSDDPNDPQNWSSRKKNIQLVVLTMASFVPDFCSGLGIASLFALAKQFDTTTTEINNLTSNWSIFLLGWGGLCSVPLMKRYGRLPVLWWSQVIGLGFLIGCAVSPNLSTFAAMRCLTAFFSTAPQCVGLWVISDMFPFHLQARKTTLWILGFVVSPFVSPFLLGYMIEHTSWRAVYWVGVGYTGLVVLLLTFVMEETMYDRHLPVVPPRHATGLRYRIDTLIGITGARMAKYRPSIFAGFASIFDVLWRPYALMIYIYVGWIFGCGIGINVTNAVFIGSPPPLGYGYKPVIEASMYATPIVAVILGEFVGRYVNDSIANRLIKRNSGVFLAEMRLWSNYLGIPFFFAGMILLGFSYEKKLNVGAVIMGWGMAEFGIVLITIACYNTLANVYPQQQGEVSALINLARVLGGFAIPFFQVPWSLANGTERVFGMEAGVGVGLFLVIIIPLQIFGRRLRTRF
ncbi:hypothetical protein JCM10908_002794 [Rhodotorula pacifica]|uniref:uncharacterized protein n=1 Tax=Rhodotorula pacifica TaxID=1495444 RepID=UPI00317CE9BF